MLLSKVNLREAADGAARVFEYVPVGKLNGQVLHVLRAEARTLDFHVHEESDELFYVVEGAFEMELEDGRIPLARGDMLIIPRGTRHRPVCREQVVCLLIETDGTLNAGNTGGTFEG